MKKIIFLLLIPTLLLAQDGSIDATFLVGDGANQNVYVVKELSDGKIIIGGQFTNYNNNAANGIARLHSDGTFDTTFNIGTGINYRVLDVLIENNGKIVVVGEFSQFNGVSRNCIVRLNADGTLDTSFTIGTSNIQEIGMVSKQNDKYIITGLFSSINGNVSNNIARLNLDGSSDLTFNSNGVNNGVAKHIVLSDNKIILVGSFTFCQGVSRNRITKLNIDGTLDTSFDPGTGPTTSLYAVGVQNDGKYLIGGNFSTYNNVSKALLARINTDGTLDTTFGIPVGYNLSATSIVIQNNDKILVGGWTTTLAGNDNFISRLNVDGSFDTNFSSGLDFDQAINSLSFQSDGKILVGGWFSTYDGIAVSRIARLNNQNSLSTNVIEMNDKLVFYPNPVNEDLFVKNYFFDDLEIEIYDSTGRIIKTDRISKDTLESINLSNLKSGVYFINYYINDVLTVKKIIKN